MTASPVPSPGRTVPDPIRRRPRRARSIRGLAPCALAACALSCSPGEPAASPGGTGATADGVAAAERVEPTPEVLAQLQELVDALTPPPPTATSQALDAHRLARRELVRELREGDPELGLLALQAFGDRPDALPPVRQGLLEVAAWRAPDRALPLLLELTLEYGEDLGLRGKACELLAAVHPARAVEELQPLILDPRPGRTLPRAELMLDSWCRAARAIGRDPVDVLTRIATDIYQPHDMRARAVEELGRYPDDRGRQALQTVLVESTGDAYLRRKAAQSLRDTLPAAEACALFEEVFRLEADLNFQSFLADMIDDNCAG